MKPRIFISSTFYDLKYIREDLANFVRSYGYEPILFEDGDIGYEPGKNLDSSCYESMRNSDMVILIIGGEYGSAASGENKDGFKEYMSVTRNEFRTAIETGIPIFVMVDKKVMAEYGVYEANYDDIEKENRIMIFPTTKNINVFRFIKEIKGIVALSIQEFERSSDIKGYISKQWADMFKNYLGSLRHEKGNRKIENSVNEMKALIRKMDIMLDSVGKNILTAEEPEKYDEVINKQEVLSFCDLITETFTFDHLGEKVKMGEVDYRENFLLLLFNSLKNAKELGVLNTNLITNINKIDELASILSSGTNRNIETNEINKYNLTYLYDKIDLVLNDKYEDEIIKLLSQDKYFLKMILYGFDY